MTPTMLTSTQKPTESDLSRDITCKPIDQQPEFANKGSPLPMALQANIPPSVRDDGGVQALPLQGPVSDAHSTEFPMTSETLNQQDLIIEGGTINISSVYSHG